MTQIQLLSDLHLEAPKAYDFYEVIPTAPHLALLGDIGCVIDSDYIGFIARQLPKFKTVFLILGNHEAYHSDWSSVKQRIRQFEEYTRENQTGYGSFVFLDQNRYDLTSEVTILGCTLFSNIMPTRFDDVSLGLNDFYQISDWTGHNHNAAHASDLNWLNAQVSQISFVEPRRKIVVFTHHSPTISPESMDPAHAESRIASAFSSDLSREACWTNPRVKLWAFGHTHYNCDYWEQVSGKRVVTNQRGYYFCQAKGFVEGKVIGC